MVNKHAFRILRPDGTADKENMAASGITAEQCLEIYRAMLTVRFMSIYGDEEGRTDRMTLFIFPLGEEAAVASVLPLQKEDWIVTYGRYWDVAIARGVDQKFIWDLFYDNPDLEAVKSFFSHNIDLPYVSVGTQLLYAVGRAIAKKVKKEPGIVAVHFGDGATAQGYHHSALNWASVYKAPVVFICRNNQKAISTPVEITTAVSTFAERAAAYGIPYEIVDGNDPFAIFTKTNKAYRHARENGPYYLELRVEPRRMGPHTTAVADIIPLTADEKKELTEKDPLRRMRLFLLSSEAKSFGVTWTPEEDLELICKIAGKKLNGLIESRHETKTIPMAWLADFLNEEGRVRIKQTMDAGEVKTAMGRSLREAEQALKHGEKLLAEMTRLNREPRFDERYFKKRISFRPQEIEDATPREAIGMALHDILLFDKDSVCGGEDVGKIGGVLRTTAISERIVETHFPALKNRVLQKAMPLQQLFPDRIFDLPLDENGIVGIFGKGLALGGLRPKIEIQFSGFSVIAFDQIVELAKTLQRTGGIAENPCVIRLPYGGGRRIDYHQSCEIGYFANIPGIIIACPSTTQDFYDLLFAASASNKPVLIFENLQLQFERNEDAKANLVRRQPWQPIEGFGIRVAKEAKGEGVTVITYGLLVYEALRAARFVERVRKGVSVEILDARVIAPFKREVLIASVAKTGRLVTVQEEPIYFGSGAEFASAVAESEESFHYLKAQIQRVAPPPAFHPFQSKHWKFYVPDWKKIARAIVKTLDA